MKTKITGEQKTSLSVSTPQGIDTALGVWVSSIPQVGKPGFLSTSLPQVNIITPSGDKTQQRTPQAIPGINLSNGEINWDRSILLHGSTVDSHQYLFCILNLGLLKQGFSTQLGKPMWVGVISQKFISSMFVHQAWLLTNTSPSCSKSTISFNMPSFLPNSSTETSSINCNRKLKAQCMLVLN